MGGRVVFDAELFDDDRVEQVTSGALGLWMRSVLWAAEHGFDIDRADLIVLSEGDSRVWRYARELVAAGLWRGSVGAGWRVRQLGLWTVERPGATGVGRMVGQRR